MIRIEKRHAWKSVAVLFGIVVGLGYLKILNAFEPNHIFQALHPFSYAGTATFKDGIVGKHSKIIIPAEGEKTPSEIVPEIGTAYVFHVPVAKRPTIHGVMEMLRSSDITVVSYNVYAKTYTGAVLYKIFFKDEDTKHAGVVFSYIDPEVSDDDLAEDIVVVYHK